ncbi:hypothetical protein [Xanthomonas campestris]|uniref:hypothetical protein n=1 Tax=Xanthomonas campestris TaxID=339 RepID=UPI00265BB252|nr:hypothetical protein [Xanthomonas campestris]MDO0817729.1 hypothetical protein [Xanthomonas campestris pv. campestris]
MNSKTLLPTPTFVNRWGFVFLPAAIALALLWLPFGFSIIGLIEEWDVLGLFTLYDPFFWVASDGPLAAHRLRPLTVAPHALAYMLDPDSFIWWHILLMGSLLTKAIAGGLIGWWLTESKRWSTILGLMVVFFPADTMQLSFRAFHINWAISLSLLAVALAAYSFTLPIAWKRGLTIVIATVFAMLATFAYEAALTFAAAPFLLLYARVGLRASISEIKNHAAVTAIWVTGALINVAYLIYAIRSGDTYQEALVSPNTQSQALDKLKMVIGVGYGRSLFGGWIDAVLIGWYEYRSRLYLVASGTIIGVALWQCSKHRIDLDATSESSAPKVSLYRIALVALILIALGYLPFAVSMPHLYTSQRTFLGATAGAALLTVSFFIAVSRRSSGVAIGLALLAITVAFAGQLFQFEHYRRLSQQQQTILNDVVRSVPPMSAHQTLLIIDEREELNDVWMLQDRLTRALTYLYDRPFNAPVICTAKGLVWQAAGADGRLGTCSATDNGWALFNAGAFDGAKATPARVLERSSTIVLTLRANGSTTTTVSAQNLADYRRQLINGHSALSERYRSVVARPSWPLHLVQFNEPTGGSTFNWQFGRWWGLDTPTRGAGWGVGGWTPSQRKLPVWYSIAWKIQPEATLEFELLPDARLYELSARIPYMVPPTTSSTIHINVNGHPIDLQWSDGQHVRAEVPAEALRVGVNVITFISPVTSTPPALSFQLDWITLQPAQSVAH